MVALQHVFDTTVEPFDHAVGLGRTWWRQAVLDVELRAEPVELMFAALCPFAHTKETVGELFAIVSQNGADPQ